MEKFYSPRDVERKFGIERNTLTNWRAKLIGPDCFRWKDKILCHARDIEEWFKVEEIEERANPKKKSNRIKADTEKQPEAPEPKPEPQPEPETEVEPYTESEPEKELLTPIEVSEKFDISHKTLANWRSEGRGPAYLKFGKQIRYPSDKLQEWFAGKEVKRYQIRRR